ncbi:MAG: hypothetical protein IJJ35_05995 [Exiguobacterium sp.]|uniref:hypothetical protein n=1 Tax=Exiguobacterium sp. TaxID=44751 RepID=UPI00257CBE4E|nr:hypothetical protein [Exiguobacterium sp.]MBQ6459134.1 hypothetical protein [Exiguobacterium sp.]
MATKSFTTDFKFTTKSGSKLLNALEHSNVVNLDRIRETERQQRVEEIKSNTQLVSIMNSFKESRQ